MTKIYNANTFLEADQIIATLQSQHISAEKRGISDMVVIIGKMDTAFEIYVSEEDAENAVKCIGQMSISDTDTSGRSRAARIYAIAALGIIAVMICLSLVL